MKEDTKRAVALAHLRDCTKELISGLTNFVPQGTVELEQENEMSSEKRRRQTCVHWRCGRDVWQYQLCFMGSATQVYLRNDDKNDHSVIYPVLVPPSTSHGKPSYV